MPTSLFKAQTCHEVRRTCSWCPETQALLLPPHTWQSHASWVWRWASTLHAAQVRTRFMFRSAAHGAKTLAASRHFHSTGWPMKNHSNRASLHVVLFATCFVIAQESRAASVDLPGVLPSMVGGGVGSTTDYAGARDRFVGAVPGCGM